MIKIKIHRDSVGNVEGFKVSGHAGYAQHGEDIICAAVSSITETAVGYAESLYNPDDEENKRGFVMSEGLLSWNRTEEALKYSDKINPVFEAMVFGLKQVAESTGDARTDKKYLVVVD